jgi:ribosome-binding factor A
MRFGVPAITSAHSICPLQKQVFNLQDSVILNGFLIFAMERRGQKHHRERLSEALREEIETILEGELGDPRIGLVTVSGVHMAEDGRSAHVLVAVTGDDSEVSRTLDGLNAAKNFVRHELAERLRLRRAPELFFQIDRSEQLESRVEELLTRAKKRNKK